MFEGAKALGDSDYPVACVHQKRCFEIEKSPLLAVFDPSWVNFTKTDFNVFHLLFCHKQKEK